VEVSEMAIDERRFPTVTFDESPSPVAPTITGGRAPQGNAEVAFGRSTAEQLGVAVGDQVVVTDPSGDDHTVTIVGIAVLPEVGTYGGSDKTSLGEGVLVDGPAFDSLTENFDKSFVVARVTGADPVAQTESLLPASDSSDWLAAAPAPVPAEVQNLDRLRSTPTLLLAMLVALLGAAVVHALIVAFRARRHDIAVLQALGWRPRQVVTTSLWQATTTGVVAVAVGLPVGLIVGRWCWTILVQEYDAVAAPVTPILGSLALAAVVLVLVNLLALIPGWQASRRAPAATLRAE
jgi:putative ABC transport system permease protein